MCAGYGFFTPGIKQRYNVDSMEFEPEAQYNIRPTLLAPIIYIKKARIIASKAKFGLVPSWANDPKIGYKMINARAETITQKPAFAKPFQSQRCLVPADYFVEWQATDHGKQPYLFRLRTKQSFAMAGIYDIWKDVEGIPFLSFCILTTSPNKLVSEVHDRMPVLLPKEEEKTWISDTKDTTVLTQLLLPFQNDLMEKTRISMRINSPNNDDPSLLTPDPEPPKQEKLLD
jgi:putative SOS response-associated peptidase YedK